MRQLIWLAFSLFVASSEAQDYPSKPIRILVPFAPGCAVDTSTRTLTQTMSERRGRNVVVQNRPGGNGLIATTAAQESGPDGYTLRIPHTGGAPAAAAAGSGDVQFGVMAAPGAIPHIKSGRGKVIGITTAKKSPLDPSWATPRDAGIPDLDASIWVGLFAPKGTPQAIVDRVNAEVRQTLNSPEVQKRFVESAGAEAVWMTPAEFLARIKADAERYKRVVQKAGVKPG